MRTKTKRKYPYNLPFRSYSARRKDGSLTVDFPYHNVPTGFNPDIRVARFDHIWKIAKIWCQENDFSWDTHGGQSVAPAWGFYLGTWFKCFGINFVENDFDSVNDVKGEWWAIFTLQHDYYWTFTKTSDGRRVLGFDKVPIK